MKKYKDTINFFTELPDICKMTLIERSPSFCFDISRIEIDSYIETHLPKETLGLITKGISEEKNIYSNVTACLIYESKKYNLEKRMVEDMDGFYEMDFKYGYVDIKNIPKVSLKEYLVMSFGFDDEFIGYIKDKYEKYFKEEIYCYIIPKNMNIITF